MEKSNNECSFSLETFGQTVTVLHISIYTRKHVFCSVRKNSIFPYGKIQFFRTEKFNFSVRKNISSVWKSPSPRKSSAPSPTVTEKPCFCMFPHEAYFTRIEKLHFPHWKYYSVRTATNIFDTETYGATTFSVRKILLFPYRSIQKHSFSVSVMVPTTVSAIRISIRKNYILRTEKCIFRTETIVFSVRKKTHSYVRKKHIFCTEKITLA